MNKKGFYNDDKDWKEKVKGFFKESGFYIMVVLGLCVLAVGAVYFTTHHLITSPNEFEEGVVPEGLRAEEGENKEIVILEETTPGKEVLRNDDLEIPDKGLEGDGEVGPDGKIEEIVSDKPEEIADNPPVEEGRIEQPTPVPTEAPQVTQAPEKQIEKAEGDTSQEVIKLFGSAPKFIMPLEGKMIVDYAMDRLLYSKTLDEWRTHSGIDIEAPRGEAVKAAGDGYIKEIKTDPCYGITITIDHENGYKSIYSNLASDSMVSVNQVVKAGDPISSVGNTAIFECLDPPHLHFEVYKNDKLIDPKSVLPKPEE